MNVRHLVWLRRISQAFFLLLFIYLLIASRLPADLYLADPTSATATDDLRLNAPVTYFFKLDPLVGLTTLVAGHQLATGFIWGLAVLIATFLFGRLFCGFVCPFGTLHHFLGWWRTALKGRQRIKANQKTPSRRIKYFIFILIMTGALGGLNLSGLMDPIALLFRSLALAVVPGLGLALGTLFEWAAASEIDMFNHLGYGAEDFLAPIFGYNPKVYQTAWCIGLVFLVVLFLNRIRPRFWCRTLCPLGALLGIGAKFSRLRLFKHQDRCTACGRCEQHCQGAAGPGPDQPWETAECLSCFNCQAACPEDALVFGFKGMPASHSSPDIGRRALIGGLVGGFSLPLLGRLDGRAGHGADPRLIRPPGSLPEEDFIELCLRCSQCMKVCPTNAVQPTFDEAGMRGFWTPHLIMRLGYCENTCTLCSSVCPTGAIKTIDAREKIDTPLKIGSAYLDRGRCLPWSGNAACIVCQEHCPTSPKAIYLRAEKVMPRTGRELTVQLPFVDLKLCVGCGICENKCPVRGLPAIRTIAAGESRNEENRILL